MIGVQDMSSEKREKVSEKMRHAIKYKKLERTKQKISQFQNPCL